MTAEPVLFPYEFGGTAFLLDPCGVAYLPEFDTLLVADLHLEKGSSFARRRQFLPPYDTMTTLSQLSVAVMRHDPATIITLGDNFHDDEASARLSQDAISMIETLARGRSLVWITGNHDPSAPEHVPGESVRELAIGDLTLRHIGDANASCGEISGHLHPCAKIKVSGRSIRKPCFASDGRRMIFPSFGAYTGGLDVQDRAFYGLFDKKRLTAFMLGSNRVFPVAASHLV